MGSQCEIQIYCANHAQAEKISGLAIDDIKRIESRYSRYRDDSILAAINQVAS